MRRSAASGPGVLAAPLLTTFLLLTTPAGANEPLPEQPADVTASGELRALLTHAGVPEAAQGLAETLSPADAQRLLGVLGSTRPTLGTFAPRQLALRMMGEVAASPRGVPLAALGERVRRYRALVIVRPDGYLAAATSGKAIQRAGRVHFATATGVLQAGAFVVGDFYFDRLGSLYRVDEKLDPVGPVVAELGLERGLGTIDHVVDGTEAALADMAWGIAELIREPVRSAQALLHLPQVVAALIENSPEYWARFVAMPRSDQIREVSRLVTELALLCGGITAVTTGARVAGQIGRLSFQTLQVTASGELVVAAAGAAVGKSVLVLTGASGGVFVLQMAQAGLPPEGSGAGGGGADKGPAPQDEPGAQAAGTGRVTGDALKAARREFNRVKAEFWKHKAATGADTYSPENLMRMRQGQAPIGPDGYPMELHHRIPLAEGGANTFDNLLPLTHTEHRLGPNYKTNHPNRP